MFSYKTFAVVLILVAIPFGASAQSPNPTSLVKTVEVTASQKEAEVGQQVKLGAIAKDAVGNVVNEQPLAYFAGPFDIAATDDAGNVKLFGAGQVTAGAIYANSKTGFTTFIVKPATIKTVEIAPITTTLVVGSTVQLEPTTRIFSGDPRTGVQLTWKSDNLRVATVNDGGVVTGIGAGKATITATSASASVTTTITVVKSNLRSLSVTGSATTARTGDVVRFAARGAPSNEFTAHWAVNGSGAMVYPDGGFVAEQPGTYIVTASVGNLSSSASIVVTPRNLERKIEVVGRAPFKEFQGAEE